MTNEEDEAFFAQLYLYHIRRHVREIFGDRKLNILDAGCGQGRLAIPLAQDGHHITGIDFTYKAIETAKSHVSQMSLNITFILGDLEQDLEALGECKFDCIICTEVLYMVPNYENVIKDLVSLLRPGGAIFISFRPRWFYVMYKLIHGQTKDAHRILINDEKYINRGTLNCQSINEMQKIFNALGIEPLSFIGIGVCCGIEGDPQARFTRPSLLPDQERSFLWEIELIAGEKYPENGRYILLCGKKTE